MTVAPTVRKVTHTDTPASSPSTPAWSRVGVPNLPRPRPFGSDVRREVILGAGFALAVLVSMLLVIYVVFILRWALGSADAPGLGGVLFFILLHGGPLTLKVPATDALLGIGGTFSVDPPATPFVLIPFLIFLAGGWITARRLSVSWAFVLASSLFYGILVGISGLLGYTSADLSQDAQMTLSAASFSSGVWAFFLAALGGTLGLSGGKGPILPEHIRQIVKGGFAAVGASFAVALLLAFVIFLSGLAPDLSDLTAGSGSEPSMTEPAPSQPGSDPQSPQSEEAGGGSGVLSGILTATGTFFSLLPSMVGSFWLLANGMPVGLQNASDLSSVPLVGPALGEIPLSLSLLGDWPLSNAWRLLLVSPIVGLVVGGMVAGRNAQNPLLSGSFVAVPYALTAAVVAALCKLGISLTVSAASVDLAFGTPILWTLALLPIGAVFGGVGGRVRKRASSPMVSYPKRAAIVTTAVSGILVLLTLPVLFVSVPSGEDLPGLPAPSMEMPEMEVPEMEEPAPPPPAPEFDLEDPA